MRDITSAYSTALDERQIKLAIFVKAQFDSGDVLLWSGIGNIVYDGQTYLGAGELLSMSPVQETTQFEAVGINFKMTGIPSEYVSLVLSQKSRNRPVAVFLGLYVSGTWELSPMFDGLMDVMSLEYDGQSATVTVTAESDALRLTENTNKYYSPEAHKAIYPDDKGLDFIPTIEDVEITWGQS